MDGRLLLKDCSVFSPDGRIRAQRAVWVDAGKIVQVGADAELPALPGDWVIDCRGRLVAPGLIDCHTHLVGGQLLPLSGARVLAGVPARFEQQQALESTLTPGEVEVLTAFAIARALRGGVTMLVEHLSAPFQVALSLAAQGRVAELLGARLVHSHTAMEGRSKVSVAAQVDANAEYAQARRGHPLVRAALGFQSSQHADDELLRRLGRAREELGVGAHFHLSETEEDLAVTYSRHGKRVVQRLESFGLLGAGSVASFARALSRSEAERLFRTRTLAALSPRHGAGSHGGESGLEALVPQQNLIGLGTGGLGSLWVELQGAFAAVMQLARMGRLLDPDALVSGFLFGGPSELCSMLFGSPSGVIEEGCLADLVVYDHLPAQEASGGLAPSLLMQLSSAPVAWTIVAGRVVVREGQLLGADYLELAAEAAEVTEAVWARTAVAAG